MQLIVKAQVERWVSDADAPYPPEQETLERLITDARTDEAEALEDEYRTNLEENGEHVLVVWSEEI